MLKEKLEIAEIGEENGRVKLSVSGAEETPSQKIRKSDLEKGEEKDLLNLENLIL